MFFCSFFCRGIGGWGRECASFPPNREIVSFRSCVRARGVSYVSSDVKCAGLARYLLSFGSGLGILYLMVFKEISKRVLSKRVLKESIRRELSMRVIKDISQR